MIVLLNIFLGGLVAFCRSDKDRFEGGLVSFCNDFNISLFNTQSSLLLYKKTNFDPGSNHTKNRSGAEGRATKYLRDF